MGFKRRGDTVVEVMVSIVVFSAIIVASLNIMNGGLATAQRTLETSIARGAIDNQVATLRFIHDGYLSERNFKTSDLQFSKIWQAIKQASLDPRNLSKENLQFNFDINSAKTCDELYQENGQIKALKAFVLNPRYIVPNYGEHVSYNGKPYSDVLKNIVVGGTDADEMSRFVPATLFPRIIYRADDGSVTSDRLKEVQGKLYQNIQDIEGLWMLAVYSNSSDRDRSEYFDFYVRTCWEAPGTKAPSTISTVVRLYNPEIIQR